MKSAVIGYPRVGGLRQLKFATEKYFRNEIDEQELQNIAVDIKIHQLKLQKSTGIDYITSNDFSYYDGMLDTITLLNAIPKKYKDLNLKPLDTYFAMARGYQGENGDAKALVMKKWFNTNYHYIEPELSDDTNIQLVNEDFLQDYYIAEKNGINTKPVVIGGFTFLKLALYVGNKTIDDYIDDIIKAYIDILDKCNKADVKWLQIDEPILVTDLNQHDLEIYNKIYLEILKHKGKVKVLLQTYFGDIRDCYKETINLDFDGIGLDFVEGEKSLQLIKENGFPKEKVLFAGIINGKNIWKSDYKQKLNNIESIKKYTDNIVINTSCSLLHVPYTLKNETQMDAVVKNRLAFAEEKLQELSDICVLQESHDAVQETKYIDNQRIFNNRNQLSNAKVQKRLLQLTEKDFVRATLRKKRGKIQQEALKLPALPTTTIGSFPQTAEVKRNRRKYRTGEISQDEYYANIKKYINECIKLQEELDIDILVHGEYERNDMVEFFGENLDGFVFTEKAWVQSYGTRCVKPPIICKDISRVKPITTYFSKYASSLSNKPVKGMLTGPVTILNWSFPREDISLKEMAYQIGLAIRDEVLDLESEGINVIQIDEAALKEKLPLRRADWNEKYLDWAIKSFRLCHSTVADTTQIHTHMCYSEFDEIIKEIDDMDADVISFEASRSNHTILESLKENNFETQVGPGVYDIHSPRVPSVEEIEEIIYTMLKAIPADNLWVNPDCGLKTRGTSETIDSLQNMVIAAKKIRKSISK